MGSTEAATVELAKGGDLEAFHRLVAHYSEPLYRLAYRITRSREDAEDAVQDAFIKAYERLDGFESRSAFGTWIYRVATNCCLDLLRKRSRRDDKTEGLDTHEYRLADSEPDPERHTVSRQIEGRLEEAMAELTEIERAAFVLRHYEGRSTAEIGEVLGVKPNAAKQTVFRAVRKIRTALEPIVRSAS